jgi:CubicO group peptidase (beta-lactamase class C family)
VDRSHHQRLTRRIPGIVAATLVDGAVECEGFGSLEDEPDPAGLRWEIGSITKVFTGTLLAEMSLRGEVGLDDPIGLHAPPEVADRLPDPARQPTLADLASHTSGLPRIPRAWLRRLRGSADPYGQLTEADVWEVLGPATTRPRRRRPHYSNYGAGLLGHLLGRAAGAAYEDLVTERILAPLGLEATGFGFTDVVPGSRGRRSTPPWTFGALQGAGALRSTAADTISFAAACLDPPGGTLGEALRLARQRRHGGRFTGIGLGWQLRALPGDEPAVWHDGGTYGGCSFLAVDPAGRIAVAAFGNRGPRLTSPLDGASWRLFEGLRRAGG